MKARIPNQGMSQADMMKKIKQMQEEMNNIQAELEASEYSASAGGGAVEVTVTGTHQVTSIKLQPEIVDKDDIEMLEDLIIAATNEAMRKADDTMESEMGKVTGGLNALNIPGLV